MNIAIDARPLSQLRNGMRHYSLCLINCLAKIDKSNEYILYVNSKPENFPFQSTNFKIQTINVKPLASKIFLLNEYLRKNKIDILHSLAFALPIPFPLLKSCKYVVTIPDLGFEVCPNWFSSREYWYWTITTRLSAYSADKIITISESTKQDITRFYRRTAKSIQVTHCGVDEEFTPIRSTEALEGVREKYGLPAEFLLYIASYHPRKNILRLMYAYSLAKKKFGIKEKLVIEGVEQNSSLQNIAKTLDIQNDVKFIKRSLHEDLPTLYSLAKFCVYPSLYEGFGLPPLESMACGTPVIASNSSSIPEVVKDAGLQINPLDISELAEAIYTLSADEELRKKLSRQGIERAKLFTWERTAIETLKVYEQCFTHKK